MINKVPLSPNILVIYEKGISAPGEWWWWKTRQKIVKQGAVILKWLIDWYQRNSNICAILSLELDTAGVRVNVTFSGIFRVIAITSNNVIALSENCVYGFEGSNSRQKWIQG